MKKKVLLSIDGGGERGLIVAVVLDYLQGNLPKPLSHYIEIAAGTSTGGILAALIRAEQGNLTDFYRVHGPVIFSTRKPDTWLRVKLAKLGLVGYRFGQKYFRDQLRAILGTKRLKDVRPLLLVCQSPKNKRGWFLTSDKARRNVDYDFALADATFATAAAPSYFEPARIVSGAGNEYMLVDGGLIAPNPGAVCFVEFIKENPETTELPYMISFGTGPDTEGADFSGKPAVLYVGDVVDAQQAGASEVAETIATTLFDFFKLSQNYLRIEPPVTGVQMDDASPKAITKLLEAGKEAITANKERLDWFTSLLIELDQ